MKTAVREQFLAGVRLNRDRISSLKAFPFSLPAIQQIEALRFDQPVTILAGENGSGKSTVIESLAVLAGFGPSGGTKGHRVDVAGDDLDLSDVISLIRNPRREKDGYFLRAESFLSVAQDIPRVYLGLYGGDLTKISHGESFIALVRNRFGAFSKENLFFLDEPESALSPARQLELLVCIDKLAKAGSQFIIATHSPILMAYPGSRLYWLSGDGVEERNWRQTDHFAITLRTLRDRDSYFKLLGLDKPESQ